LWDFLVDQGLDRDFWLRKLQKQCSGRFGFAFTPAKMTGLGGLFSHPSQKARRMGNSK
jgi:hypothetical protein